jgi:hypothetical protein
MKMSPHNTHTRDAALRKSRRINRWLIAGSITLTGVLADVAANAFPGKTVKAAATSKGKSSSSHSKRSSAASPSTSSTQPLKPPAQAPQATTESAPSQESTPSQEAGTTHESAPAQESAPEASHESAPAQEAPVVSGGS